jgi:hypothetical protein
MFISDKLVSLLEIGKETVSTLREEASALRVEVAVLREQLSKAQIMQDWLRVKVNQLELQNGALLEKAYNIKVTVPEIAKRLTIDPTFDPKNFSFDDVGNELARKIGLPTYDEQ